MRRSELLKLKKLKNQQKLKQIHQKYVDYAYIDFKSPTVPYSDLIFE